MSREKSVLFDKEFYSFISTQPSNVIDKFKLLKHLKSVLVDDDNDIETMLFNKTYVMNRKGHLFYNGDSYIINKPLN